MQWQDWVTVASLAAVVAAVVWGRRKGRARLAAALSAARAEGHAQATAELSAKLVNHVQVVAGNSLPGEVGRDSDAIVAALRFLAVEQSRSFDATDQRAAADDLAALINGTRSDRGVNDDHVAIDRGAGRVVCRDGSLRDLGDGKAVVL